MPQVAESRTFSQSVYIFDLDGTLFDSASQIASAVNATRTVLGYPQLTILEIRELIGLPAEELFGDLNLQSDALIQGVKAFRMALAEAAKKENAIFPGAFNLLNDLREKGAFIGVATSKPQELAELVILHSELNGLFDHIQGTGHLRPKPHPDTIVACLEHAKLDFGVMVGDRTEDILAGNLAGVTTLGVAQSTHTPEMLLEAGAKHVFKSLKEMYLGIDELPLGSVWNREVL
jgi:phosphoglycolate phosphatase